jgi:TonB family protein
MKKFLMAAIAVFVMSGSAMAAESVIMTKNNAIIAQSGNVMDKFITIVNSYTKKVNATESIGELMAVTEQCHKEMMEFMEMHESEFAALENTLSEQQLAGYERKFEKAITGFEVAVELKVEQFTESIDNLIINDEIVEVEELGDSVFVEEEVVFDVFVEEEVDEEQIFDVVEEQPQFPGGAAAMMKFLSNNIQYPRISRDNGSQGRAMVRFTVNSDGSIQDTEIIKSTGDMYLDREALRLVESMPKWSPGRQNGKPVRVKFVLPVNFHLQDNPKPSSAKR